MLGSNKQTHIATRSEQTRSCGMVLNSNSRARDYIIPRPNKQTRRKQSTSKNDQGIVLRLMKRGREKRCKAVHGGERDGPLPKFRQDTKFQILIPHTHVAILFVCRFKKMGEVMASRLVYRSRQTNTGIARYRDLPFKIQRGQLKEPWPIKIR